MERTPRPQSRERTEPSGRGPCDLRQFIAALLTFFLTLPTSFSPHLLAASDPGRPSAVSRQSSAVTIQSSTISDAALSRQAPTLNGGTIDGSLRVFEGKNFDLGSKFAITGDLFVVGTPEIEPQQDVTYGGTVDEGGAAAPSYKIKLQNGVSFPGKIHIRTDAVPLPADIPVSVPAPAGTRKVNVNKAEDVAAIGDWQTVRDLTINASSVTIDVPPGNYGSFTTNGPAILRFSGGDYNFAAGLSLQQESSVEVGGPASISIGSSFSNNGGKILAVGDLKPHQLKLNLLGNTVNLSGDTRLEALVRAPQAHVSINGEDVVVRGQLIADRLTLTAGRIIGDQFPGDTTPPLVQVLSPSENTSVYTSSVPVRGLARDEGEVKTGVKSVTVNGVAADFDPAGGNWMANVPLALGDNLISIAAQDGASPPNVGRAQIHVVRKNPPPPTLSLTHPSDGAFVAANTITVAGRVTSESPEVTLSVTVNGQPATLAGSEFARSITLVDGANPITVVATDSLGQSAPQAISVTCDLVPPQVSLVSVPSVVLPGSSYRVAAEASDNYRLTSVEFTVDGRRQAEFPAPPFEFTYLVPPTHVAGQRITVSALARDASGRVGMDSAESRVAGPGGVAGRVFDDLTGYPLSQVTVSSTDGAAAESAADGAWFFVSPLSLGVARFSKSGFTSCERDFALDSGKGAWLLDARLTPIDGHQNEIGPDGGQAADASGRLQATVAAAMFDAPLDVRLTAVSQQGLIGVLPFGWSPVPGGVVDFRPFNPPAGLSDRLRSPVRLVISSLPDPLNGMAPSLVFYDESSHCWTVVEPQVAGDGNGSLAADLGRFGQYAFVVPDSGATAPPPPVRDRALGIGPTAAHSALNSATAFATASPAVALYSPEAQSTIKVTADPGTKLPSGIWSEASFDERYDLRGQSEPKLVERASQTFVLYSYPAATSSDPNRLAASFTAKPTILDYPLAEFRAANLHVHIRSAEPDPGTLAGSSGGTIRAAGGVELELPDGALTQPTPVFLKALSADEVSVLLPDGYEILGGALVDLSGATLTTSARLSLPAFSPETSRTVVARIITAGDRRAPKLVARAIELGGRLESAVSPPAVPPGLVLPGVTEGGVYAFICLPDPFGYVFGSVTRAVSGAAPPGVRVAGDTNPFVDVTSASGRYLLPGKAGTGFEGLNNLSAASLASDETGNATASLASQDALAETTLVIASVPLAIASVTPTAGASGIAVSTTVRITFTKPVRAASVTSSSFKVATAGGNPVAGTVAVLAGNQAATFTPLASLAAGTTYRVSLSNAVLDLYGNLLPAAFSSTFATAAIQPVSGRLTANNISISYPDALGFVTISIPAGVIPAGWTVVALNQTLGSSTTVSAGSGPLKIRLLARVGDDIRIIVRQPSGVDYEVAQAAYRNADGFSAVGPGGGTVVSDDGTILLVIEPGAINGLAEIRVSPAPESSIPIPREPGTPMDPANVPFGAGVTIESRGTFTVEKELHLEVAAPPGVPEGRRVICLSPSKATDPDTGEEVDVWDSVTSAVVQNGRFKTTSLPFSGLGQLHDIFVVYLFMPTFSHILWGWVKGWDTCEEDAALVPVPGVLCVNPTISGATMRGQVTARTNRDGLYAMFNVFPSATTNIVLFIDEANHRRTVSGTTITGVTAPDGEIIRFLSGLQGFTYGGVDAILPCPPSYAIASPPVIVMTGKQVNLEPGQADPLPVSGVARVGATVEVTAVADRPLAPINGRVFVGGASPQQLNWRNETPECTTRCQYSTIIEAAAEGGYLVDVTGYSGAAPPATVTYQFVALRDPNFRPPLEGPPFVLSCTPKEGAKEVDIATDIRVEFSEPVKNLVGGTTVFLEESENSKIGGVVLSGGIPVTPDQSVSSIVFKADRPLIGGQSYVFHVKEDVVDSNGLQLHNGPNNEAPGEFTSRFTTFAGKVLSSKALSSSGGNGLRVAVDGRYSFIVELESLVSSNLVAYDAADPRNPKEIGRLQLPQMAIDFAVSSETEYEVTGGFVRRIGVITAFYPMSLDRAANLWIVNLDDPQLPSIIGVVSLYFPENLTAVPLAVALHGGRAYVGNAPYRGVFVVDIKAAIEMWLWQTAQGWEQPRYLAVMPYRGFGEAAIVQNLLYQDSNPSVPAMANSIAVITQDVLDEGPAITGVMPVVFAVDLADRALLAAGFPSSQDGTFGYLPGGRFGDARILSWVEVKDAVPLGVQAISKMPVGSEVKDLVVLLTSEDLRIYDATHHPMSVPIGAASLQTLGVSGQTNRLVVEDGLAYIASAGGLSVVDISRPTNPSLVTLLAGKWFGSTSLSVQDGFVHSIRPNEPYNIGIARPVAQVFVHGLAGTVAPGDDISARLCSNPVILDRNNPDHPMLHPAEILFQVFGMTTEMEQGKVIIRKGEEILETLTVSLRNSVDYDVITGAVTWQSPKTEPIDITASYTAQVVLGDFQTEREAIPMSFLLPEYQTTIQVLTQGPLDQAAETRPYSYVLGANAAVSISVGGKERLNAFRTFGLNTEKLNLSDLEVGRYELKLRAQLPGVGGYGEEMIGVLEIAANPNDVRVPNHTIVGGIDLGTGQLGLTYTDLTIKGRGLSLEFTRSYNQAAANVFGPLGYGWRHNYQMLLVHNQEERVYTIIGGDAQGETFLEAAPTLPGGSAPPALPEGGTRSMRSLSPFHTTLVENDDHSFDYYNKAHIKYHFPGALERDSYSYYRQAYMGNLDYIEDGYRNQIQLYYDGLGRLAKVCDASDRCLALTYEEALAPFVGVVLPNLSGHSSATCVPADHFPLIRDHFAKSDAGKAWRISRIQGPGGLDIDYDYDADGNLKLVNRSGETFVLPGGGADNPGVDSKVTDDYVWQYFYKPPAASPPLPGGGGNVASANLNHILWQILSPNGARTEYEFRQDNAGLPVLAAHYPEGVTNSFSYNLDGVKILSLNLTDGRGVQTNYELQREKVVSIRVGGALTEFEYDHEKGLKKWEIDPLGMVRTYEYDDNGNVTRLTQTGQSAPLSDVVETTATFDPTFNRPLQRTDANTKPTNFRLNGGGDVEHVDFADGSTIELVYDKLGQLTEVIDRLGLKTKYQDYDPFGNPRTVIQETEPGKTVTTQNEWDALSRLVSTSSTLGPAMTYRYDKQDRVRDSVTSDPSNIRTSLSVTYTYKPGGQLLTEFKQTTANANAPQSHKITYTYDLLDRRTGIKDEISDRDAVTIYNREFRYDNNSNLIWETNRRGIGSRYTYNDQNFLDKHEIYEQQADGTWVLKSVEADPTPDLIGNSASVIDRYGNSTTLQYDGLHRLIGREIGGFTESWKLDGNGNITKFTDREGRVSDFEYDELNRVTLRKDPLKRETRWTYDLLENRNITTMTQPHRGLTVVAESDALDRPRYEKITCEHCSGAPYETTWTYTDDARKVEISDPRGNVTTRLVSGQGDVGSVQLGREKTVKKYTGLGGVYSLTDGRNKEWIYELDGLNRVRTTWHPEVDRTRAPPVSIQEAFTYDGEGNLTRHISRRDIETVQTYDHLGRVLKRTVGPVDVDRFGYDDLAHTVTRTDANAHAIVFHYDPLGRLNRVENARGETKSFEWNGVNVIGEIDFRGKETSYKYDDVDRLKLVTDRLGRATEIKNEDNAGLVRTTTDRRGYTRIEIFDGLDRLISVDWGEPLARYEYDGNDNRTRQTDGEGRWIAYQYGAENWVEQANHGDLRHETFGYDAAGNLLTYFDGAGGTAEQVFDGLGRVVTRKDGLGNPTNFVYDGELLRQKADPLGHVTRYEYNELGSLTQVKDARQNTWTYTYDAAQNLVKVSDPLDVEGNRATTFIPDELNRIQTVRSALSRERTYGYDANSNLTLRTDPKGHVRSTTYDEMDQPDVTTISSAGEQRLKWKYHFDAEGNLFNIQETIGVSPSARAYTRGYDHRNRLTLAKDPFERSVSFTYDAADNLSTFVDALTRTTQYGYDGANRLLTATLPDEHQPVEFGWRGDNLVEDVRYPGGMTRHYAYDAADRMTGVTNQVSPTESEEFGYTYDADSNRRTETRKINGQTSRQLSYEYDDLERLTRAAYGGTSAIDYTYDAVGNRQTEIGQDPSGQAVNRTYTVNAANELTAVADSVNPAASFAFTYDPNGNLATEQSSTLTRQFQHDGADRLVQVSTGGQVAGSYDYDYQGRRIARATAAGITQYVYRGDGIQVSNEFSAWGDAIGSYDFASDLVRADLPEGRRWYFHDALGSTTSLSPVQGGAPSVRHEYDAWGQLISPPQPTSNRVLYTGYRRDDESGLDYALARYYDPRFGRFLQQDPLPDLVEQSRQKAVAAFTYENLAAAQEAWTSKEFEGRQDAFESLTLAGAVHNKLKALQWAREEVQPAEWTGATPGNVARRSERKEHRGDTLTENPNALSDSPDLPESLNAAGLSVPGPAPGEPALWNRYIYGSNNPLRFIDPRGEGVWDCVKRAAKAAVDTVVETVEGTVATATGMAKDPIGTTKEVVKGTVELVKVAGRAYFTEEGREEFSRQWSGLSTEDKVEAISRGVTAGVIAVVGSKVMPKVTRAVTSGVQTGLAKLPQLQVRVRLTATVARTGETVSTRMGREAHAWIAAERRAGAYGHFDLVNQPIPGASGNPIRVPHRVDLRTGAPQAGTYLQEAVPDAVSFKRGLILEDKPLGRPIPKDRQEIIRAIRAYEASQGELPTRIAIPRYDPATGEFVRTDLYTPSDFLPRKR